MNTGFYVSIFRGKQFRLIAGPYPTEPDARARLTEMRLRANELDPRTSFDFFGTCRVQQTEPLPNGILTPSQHLLF